MQQAQSRFREDLAAQALELLRRRARRQRLRLLDERADDERLVSLLHLSANELVRLVAAVRRHPARLHRLASRRHLVDDRHVEVAVDGEGERARDRRRRHDQHVRIASLLPKRRPLHHAEAVLLVDDRQPEAVEADAPPG